MGLVCPDHVLHCHIVDSNIDTKPGSTPTIWPVQVGTNLTSTEVQTLFEGGYRVEMVSGECDRTNVQAPSLKEFDTQTVHTPMQSGRPNSRDGVRSKYRTTISAEAARKIALALALKARVTEEICRAEGAHEVFKLESYGADHQVNTYEVQVCKEPSCTCSDFSERVSRKQPYMACKHMYFIFLCVLG